MKKNNQSLFRLIKSLNRNEKGYFKKHNLQNGEKEENNYILLFDAIDKQKEYDEEKVRKQFSGTKLGEHFHVSKMHLYQVIFKNLRTYYSHFSIEAELHDMFRDAEIMLNNNLHDDCRVLLQKILKIATENEFFLVILETYYYSIRVEFCTDSKKLELDHIVQLECLKKYENLVEYRVLRNKLELTPRIFDVEKNKQVLFQYREIMNNELLLNPNKALSWRAKSYFNSIHSIISSFYTEGYSKSYEMNKQFVAEFEEKKGNHIAWFHVYIESVNSLLKDQLNLGKYSEFKITLNKLKNKQEKSPFIKVNAFAKLILNETNYFIQLVCIKEGLELIRDHEMELKELKQLHELKDLKEPTQIYFNCSLICFMNGDFSDSLRWINNIEDDKPDVRNDFELFMLIYRLIVYYELGDFDYLENALRSTVVFIEKFRKLFPLEILIINFLKKNNKNFILKNEVLQELKQGLANTAEDVSKKKILTLFDLISWVDSKIEKRPFVEILKEKSKKTHSRKFVNPRA